MKRIIAHIAFSFFPENFIAQFLWNFKQPLGMAVPNFSMAIRNHGVAIRNCGMTIQNFGIAVRNLCVAIPNIGMAVPNFGIAVRNFGIAVPNLRIAIRKAKTSKFNQKNAFPYLPGSQVIKAGSCRLAFH